MKFRPAISCRPIAAFEYSVKYPENCLAAFTLPNKDSNQRLTQVTVFYRYFTICMNLACFIDIRRTKSQRAYIQERKMAFNSMINNARNHAATLLSVAGLLLTSNTLASTLDIASMNITAGGYKVWDSNGKAVTNPDTGGTYWAFTTFGPDTNLVDGYIGNGGGGLPPLTPDPDSIAGNLWFGTPVNIYTAATNLGDDLTTAGSITGGAVPFGTLDDINNTIEMDLSSLFGNWANIDFNIGTGKSDGVTSALASGTWNPLTNAYTLSWVTIVDNSVGGPCLPTNCTAEFLFEGTANAVPLPAAVWLFGSGLIGLAGVARQKKYITIKC